MKNLFVFIIALLINIGLSGQVQTFFLDPDSDGIIFTVCETECDSVIVYKYFWDTECGFGNPDVGYFLQDSIIITPETQGVWEYASFEIIHFTVIFSIEPTEPFITEELYKCPDSSIELLGQTEDMPDFTYMWGNGETTPSININSTDIIYITVTGTCGEVTDTVEVINWITPEPELGDNILSCNGTIVTLDPGEFTNYEWSNGTNDTILEVTTTDSYETTVTDSNGCQAIDNITVTFTTNPGQEILLVTIDTISGNNKVLWEITSDSFVLVNIFRESPTNEYIQVGTSQYTTGSWTDDISSTNQYWRYKISTIDTCGNESFMSAYHQTISTTTVPTEEGGYLVEWSPYLIEGNSSITNYYIFTTEGLDINWNITEIAQITGDVTEYILPETNEGLFLVGAELPGKTNISELALSNVISNPFVQNKLSNTINFNIFPNPASDKIEILTSATKYKVKIINNIGQTVIKQNNSRIIDISGLTKGNYIVQIIFEDKNIYKKLLIE